MWHFVYFDFIYHWQALTSHDSTRTRIWFPMFSYFESSVDGIIPNEYTSLENICSDISGCVASARDSCMLTARRFWLANQQLVSPEFPKKIFQFNFNKDDASQAMMNANHQEKDDHLNTTKANETNDCSDSIASNNLNLTVKSQQTKKQN